MHNIINKINKSIVLGLFGFIFICDGVGEDKVSGARSVLGGIPGLLGQIAAFDEKNHRKQLLTLDSASIYLV